jgi:hypothetical protein
MITVLSGCLTTIIGQDTATNTFKPRSLSNVALSPTAVPWSVQDTAPSASANPCCLEDSAWSRGAVTTNSGITSMTTFGDAHGPWSASIRLENLRLKTRRSSTSILSNTTVLAAHAPDVLLLPIKPNRAIQRSPPILPAVIYRLQEKGNGTTMWIH